MIVTLVIPKNVYEWYERGYRHPPKAMEDILKQYVETVKLQPQKS